MKPLFISLIVLVLLGVAYFGIKFYTPKKETPKQEFSNYDFKAEVASIKDTATIAKELDQDLAKGTEVTVPGTKITFVNPLNYNFQINPEKTNHAFVESAKLIAKSYKAPSKTLLDLFYCNNLDTGVDKPSYIDAVFCNKLYSNYSTETLAYIRENILFDPREGRGLDIYKIDTNLMPEEWVLDNLVYQGMTLREIYQRDFDIGSLGKYVEINGSKFYSIGIGCCAYYERTYLYRYKDENNKYMLIAFNNNNINAKTDEDHNMILDKILKTFRL